MDFKIEKKESPTKDKYDKSDVHLAYTFAKNIWKEFDRFCKCIVLFGSTTRDPGQKEGDIDVLIVVDDVSFNLTADVVETYRLLVEKHIAQVSTRVHVTTLKFTTFWELIRTGDPIGINILREGVAMIDTGFFSPVQMLLYQGRIRPTEESSLAYLSRAPQTLYNSKWHLLQASVDLYWAAIDAAHAAIMKTGMLPPSPREISEVVKRELADKKLVDKSCPKIMQNLYETSKKILHREVKEISGKQYDDLLKESQFFVDEMKRYVRGAKG